MSGLVDGLGEFWRGTTGFDYVDRLIVFWFLTINFAVTIAWLSEQFTPAEAAEIGPAVNALSYVLLFFVAWPVIRLIGRMGWNWATDRYSEAA